MKHKKIEMQRYLKSNGLKMKQEEVIEIVKLRSRMSDVKTNFRGKYDNFECEFCNEIDETQKQMLDCQEIKKYKKLNEKIPEYEQIAQGNVKRKLKIAKPFFENISIRKKFS